MNPFAEVILWAVLATCGRTHVTLCDPFAGRVHHVFAGEADWCCPAIDYVCKDSEHRVLYRSWARYDRDVFHARQPVQRVSFVQDNRK